ncbi:MAG TPA: hypothetical protein VFE25_03490 [Opitutaceae bacterium]|nr:hypothetical protein [Opitutaceae bacterium]
MNTSTENTQDKLSALQSELEAVKRREAEYRAKMVQEFLDRGERNTYVHTLHEERAALRKRQQESFGDLENLIRKLEAEVERSTALEAELSRIGRSLSWKITAPLRSIAAMLRPSSQPPTMARIMDRMPVEGGVFTYYLHTSPFRIYRDDTFTLRGWAWPQDGRSITAIRINLSGRTFIGRQGLEEPEVIARYGAQPANPKPGFEVTFETPPGRHNLSLEAQIDGGEWLWIVKTSIWCEPKGK